MPLIPVGEGLIILGFLAVSPLFCAGSKALPSPPDPPLPDAPHPGLKHISRGPLNLFTLLTETTEELFTVNTILRCQRGIWLSQDLQSTAQSPAV